LTAADHKFRIALIPPTDGKNPGALNSAEEEVTGVLPCLWAVRFGTDECPALKDSWCCLVRDELWPCEDGFAAGDEPF